MLFVPGPDGQSIQVQVLTTADGKFIAQQVVPPTAGASNAGPAAASPPPPPPATPLPHAVFLRALFSFDAQTADDLPFRKGDRMLLTKPYAFFFYCSNILQNMYVHSGFLGVDCRTLSLTSYFACCFLRCPIMTADITSEKQSEV